MSRSERVLLSAGWGVGIPQRGKVVVPPVWHSGVGHDGSEPIEIEVPAWSDAGCVVRLGEALGEDERRHPACARSETDKRQVPSGLGRSTTSPVGGRHSRIVTICGGEPSSSVIRSSTLPVAGSPVQVPNQRATRWGSVSADQMSSLELSKVRTNSSLIPSSSRSTCPSGVVTLMVWSSCSGGPPNSVAE